jgi:hypothetical protein
MAENQKQVATSAQIKPPPEQPLATKPPDEVVIDDGELVTYLPAAGDKPTTRWRGLEFKANVPVRVTDKDHLEAIKGNPFFRVGKGDGKYPDRHPSDAPTNPMEYRAHVVAWIKEISAKSDPPGTIEDIVKHWADDRALRQTCDAGSDDIKWLGTIVEPKLMEFKRRDGLNENQVAQVWIKYGFVEIPWRG